jgi:hypothetical protein
MFAGLIAIQTNISVQIAIVLALAIISANLGSHSFANSSRIPVGRRRPPFIKRLFLNTIKIYLQGDGKTRFTDKVMGGQFALGVLMVRTAGPVVKRRF